MHNQKKISFLRAPVTGSRAVVLKFDHIFFKNKSSLKKFLHNVKGQWYEMPTAAGIPD